jgi:hypothetical protein
MNEQLSRKGFLMQTGKYAAGAVLGASAISMLTQEKTRAGIMATPWPWPYQKLDPEAARILGHDAYYSKGCCYGAFHAIMEQLRAVLPDPYASLPSEIMCYGGGGGAGWGLTCGAANGSAALISLVRDTAKANALISELFGWYTQTMLPTDASNQLAIAQAYTQNKLTEALTQNAAGSVLCHVSVTEWCTTAKKTQADAARKERCARVTGDTAAYAIQILNDDTDGKFTPLYVPPATIAGCMTCHGTTMINDVSSKMECTQCHGDPHASSSAGKLVGGTATAYSLSKNYPNPFNPTTTIEFSVPKEENVTINVYDVHGRFVRSLVNGEGYTQGHYSVRWDGTNSKGESVASGIYFTRMKAGQFTTVQKMILEK